MEIDPKLVDRLVALVKNVQSGYANVDIECLNVGDKGWFEERDAVLDVVREDLESKSR